jgi:prepilin-type N-terminal cleavage/methylation domain-containing protein
MNIVLYLNQGGRRMSNKKGFTLIEILVVLIIIGILACVAIPNYIIMTEQGMARNAINNTWIIWEAEQSYYFNHGTYYLGNPLTDLGIHLNLNIQDNNYTYNCYNAINNVPSSFQCEVARQGFLQSPNAGTHIILNPSTPNKLLVCYTAYGPNYCP